MAESMTQKDWAELDRLCRKARFDPNTSEASAEYLQGVSIWASRRAG